MAERRVLFDIIGSDHASPALLRVAGSADKAAASVTRLQAASERTRAVGATLTRHLSLPLLAIGGLATKAATDFNAAMLRIQTQAGGSARDVQVLSKAVLNLKGAQQGPVELANALYHLKSVGLANVPALKALRQASDLAAVGHANLEETTNALAGAWRTGIRGAQNFHQAVSTINAIIGAGNMTLEDFNAALGTGILPSAKTFGLTLKDVGSALALFTDEGVPADAAATRLRMTFSLLGAPSAHAADQLAKIGIGGLRLANDLRKPNGLLVAVADLKNHLEDPKFHLSLSQQAALLSRAFGGGRSSSAILSLVNNLDVLRQKYGQVARGADRFNEAVAAQKASPAAKFHQFTAELQKAGILLGNQLLPLATAFVSKFTGVVKWFSGLSSGTKKVITEVGLGLIVLGPVLSLVGRLGQAFGLLVRTQGVTQAAFRRTGAVILGSSEQSSTALRAQAVIAQQTAAEFSLAEASKARVTADSARMIALQLRGTDSALAADAAAAARDAETFAVAMEARANAAVGSASRVTAALLEEQRVAGATTAAVGRAGVAGVGGRVVGGGGAAAAAGGSRAGRFFGGGGGLALGFGAAVAGQAVGGQGGAYLTGAGTGALLGSFAGPIGTGVGAAAGTALVAVQQLRTVVAQFGDPIKSLVRFSGSLSGTFRNSASAVRLFGRAALYTGTALHQADRQVAQYLAKQGGLSAAAHKAGLTQKDLSNAILNGGKDFQRVADILKATDPFWKLHVDRLTQVRREYHAGETAAIAQASATGRIVPQFTKMASATQLLTGAQFRLGSATKNTAGTARAFGVSLRALTASVAKNGATLDRDTLFGQQNAVALQQAARASLRHAQAVAVRTGSVRAGTAALESDRRKLIDTATAAGLSAGQARRLANEIYGIPRNYKSKINVNVAAARANVNGLRTDILGVINLAANANPTVHVGVAVDKLPPILIGSSNGTPNNTAPPKRKALGGWIHGPGTPTSDSVPALLSNGEFVVNARQAQRHRGLLENLNKGVRGFAAGGPVNPLKFTPTSGAHPTATNVAPLISALNSLRGAISGGVGGARASLRGFLKDLAKAGASLAQGTAAAATANTFLANQAKLVAARSLLAKVTAYGTNVRQSLTSNFDPTRSGSVADLITTYQAQTGQNTAYTSELRRLRRRAHGNRAELGLINTLAGSGQTASLQALAGGSRTDLLNAGKAYRQYNASVQGGVDAATRTRYGVTQAHETGVVDRLVDRQDRLIEVLARLGAALAGNASGNHAHVEAQLNALVSELEALTRHGRARHP